MSKIIIKNLDLTGNNSKLHIIKGSPFVIQNVKERVVGKGVLVIGL